MSKPAQDKTAQGTYNTPASASASTLAPSAAIGNASLKWSLADLGILGLLVIEVYYFLSLSWRKWPDPIIDFGRELYVPWRLNNGAVLYRDIEHTYGPFSQYYNALVFKILGVSFSSLITSNVIIYGIILGLLYTLLRAGWGRPAAFVACAVFVGVFSFSNLVLINNYNYITPYSHETTHGILVVLLLATTLRSCIRRPAGWKMFCAGLLGGAAVLLKPEIILASAAVVIGAILVTLMRSGFAVLKKGTWLRSAGLFVAGGITAMLLAVVLLRVAGLSWSDALFYSNSSWLNVFIFSGFYGQTLQKSMMGTDNLWGNISNEALYGAAVPAFAVGLALYCRQFAQRGKISMGIGLILIAGAGAYLGKNVDWLNGVAFALPGILILVALFEGTRMLKGTETFGGDASARVLLWCAGAAFLVRMAFNPRVAHYGYFQAPLASVVCIAALLSTVPEFLEIEGLTKKVYQVCLALLTLFGAWTITQRSAYLLSLHNVAVGEGKDQFFALTPQIEIEQGGKKMTQMVDFSGALVEAARQKLAQDTDAHSLVVLPEGVMLNYLTRLPDPIPNFLFDPGQIMGREDKILARLQAAPPDRIVLISRDLTEYDVGRFGESIPHGQGIMDFVQKNYDPFFLWPQGSDPLDTRTSRGVMILKRKQSSSVPVK